MNSRRKFTKTFLCSLLLPKFAKAYPLDQILGHPSEEFVRAYLHRYWNWYNKKWFHFSMQESEKKLWNHWHRRLQSFGQQLTSNLYIENFLTRHLVKNGKIDSSSYYCGLPVWDNEGIVLLYDFLKDVAPAFVPEPWHQKQILGWSRNFTEKTTRLWFRKPTQTSFFKNSQADLGFFEFSQEKLIRQSSLRFAQEVDPRLFNQLDSRAVISGFHKVDDLGNEGWAVRTRSTFLPSLKQNIQGVTARHQMEFRQVPDFLDIGSSKANAIKIYYP